MTNYTKYPFIRRAEAVFVKYGFAADSFWSIVKMYEEPHRFYHGLEHLEDVLSKIFALKFPKHRSGMSPLEILVITAPFHDSVYDIMDPGENEKKSVNMFRRYHACIDSTHRPKFSEKNRDKVCTIILDTARRHQPFHPEDLSLTKLSVMFWQIDNSVLDRDFAGLLRWEAQIFKEYQAYSFDKYRVGRLLFLEEEIEKRESNRSNLIALYEYVKTFRPTIAVYPGSFNPFHIGHYNILQKAERLVDKVVLLKAINPEKENATNQLDFPKAVHNREMVQWDGMLHEFLRKVENADANVVLIRGLRNGNDLSYEVNQLRFIEEYYPDVKVVYLPCDKEYEHISSSAIRSLDKIDKKLTERFLNFTI